MTPRTATLTALMILDAVPDRRWQTAHERILDRPQARGPDIDLGYHLRRVRLPDPAGVPQLLEFAQQAAMTPFDCARPLWEATLVEGLPDGKAAYLLKLHRSLAGSTGSLRRLSPPPRDHRAVPLRPHRSATGRLLSAGTQAVTHPLDTVASALRLAASLRHAAAPLTIPGSPLFRGRTGASWRYGVLECRLADLAAAARLAGASVHDAYLAAVLGGMRRYHERHGVTVETMPMTIPVALPGRRGAGRSVGAMIAAPAGLRDPSERIATIRGIMLSLRVEPVLDVLPVLVPVVKRLPSTVGSTAARFLTTADLSASYRPGSPRPTRLAGVMVERVYPFGPVPGAAVTSGMISHAGVCCVGLTIDGSAVPDTDILVSCLHEGFEEVLATAAAPLPSS